MTTMIAEQTQMKVWIDYSEEEWGIPVPSGVITDRASGIKLLLKEDIPSIELCLEMGIKEEEEYWSDYGREEEEAILSGADLIHPFSHSTYTGQVEVTMANQDVWLAKGDGRNITLRRLS